MSIAELLILYLGGVCNGILTQDFRKEYMLMFEIIVNHILEVFVVVPVLI